MPLISLPDRKKRLDRLDETFDVLVVGGGATGAGLALDLAVRGVRVTLVERDDWAAATSSASSRLIHGGLRYLEQLEFGLVRESCLERSLLLRNAAGLVWPERFVFPIYRDGSVGRLKLAAGLFLYTAVSIPRVLGIPRILGASAIERAVPGIERAGLVGGGSYLDGATDDARLCMTVVMTAIEAGAIAVSRMEATNITNGASGAEVTLRDRLTGERRDIRARAVVLAGGPFTDELRANAELTGNWVEPTRGTHILVPRDRLPTDGAVILNSSVDGRVLFFVPWPRFTVIGTTDIEAPASRNVRATRDEVRYLLDSANALVPSAALREDDVVSTYAGLRPLITDPSAHPSARSREERVEQDGSIYTIAGGKLTAFRVMAERLGRRIARDIGIGRTDRVSPTRSLRLRGALPAPVGRPGWSSLHPENRQADATSRYGAYAAEVDEVCARVDSGGERLSEDTLLGELDWAIENEDCLCATDFLFRRTDLGIEPRDIAESAMERVIERMASALDWPGDRIERERNIASESIAERHRWRDDTPGSAASLAARRERESRPAGAEPI